MGICGLGKSLKMPILFILISKYLKENSILAPSMNWDDFERKEHFIPKPLNS